MQAVLATMTSTAIGGNDHVYGDSGFNTDFTPHLGETDLIQLSTQIMTVVHTTGTPVPTEIEGMDTIRGGDGVDIAFGDHGIISQTRTPQAEHGNIPSNVRRATAVNHWERGTDRNDQRGQR